jgi:glycosyltransferase involved in cell wall biosynthesis
LPERYLLTVGTIEPRKNLERLLDALALLRRQGEDVHLVIVGSKGWLYNAFFEKLESFPHRDAVVQPGFIPDADLPAVYSGATMTVMASLYEGFGLPILESMACGTPVVSSHAASLPELGGDAACYFDPLDVDEMASEIRTLWRSNGLREELGERGHLQAAKFSAKRTVDETIDVYRRVDAEIL